MRILGGFSTRVQGMSASSSFAYSIVINFAHRIQMNELSTLTLNLVVEISAFRMSGSYFVLDEEPENTFFKRQIKDKYLSTLKSSISPSMNPC